MARAYVTVQVSWWVHPLGKALVIAAAAGLFRAARIGHEKVVGWFMDIVAAGGWRVVKGRGVPENMQILSRN